MNSRNDPTDPANMSPEERVAEIATILSAGVLRLRRQSAVSSTCPPSILPMESEPNSLEELGQESLNGRRDGRENPCETEEER
jgi:hypothetical protein